ncbi:MAG: Holliday junction branch migration protein RuvA [Bacteroidetes bacterium]|jgi:Holliday junction DNA helicase RuvA|nr:Holliday junction branch migration protein RuvA [Bacteroidota bacterium]
MIDFIEGHLIEKSPAHVVIQSGGIGYFVHISLFSYSQLEKKEQSKVYIYEIIREDAHLLFGFVTKAERNIFELLISVNGVGANTARMILSSLNPDEVRSAIASDNTGAFQNIKGIGAKSAQRIIVDLKDKITKESAEHDLISMPNNRIKEEALSALVMLGFVKKSAEKVIDNIIRSESSIALEDLIKKALKQL